MKESKMMIMKSTYCVGISLAILPIMENDCEIKVFTFNTLPVDTIWRITKWLERISS